MMRHLWVLVRQLFRRQPVIFQAPELEPGTLCGRCGRAASEQWYPAVCALVDAPKSWIPLCAVCDVILNEITVRFLYGKRREEYLTAYREQQLEPLGEK